MKILLLVLSTFAFMSFTKWENNLDNAKKKASETHKYILLNFSGSDWCGPCIRMHKEIFNDSSFASFSDKNLVLINADFPRLSKNQLSKEAQDNNEMLADKYNSKGAFPYTVLLDADGKVLKSWDGLPKETPSAFVNEIETAIHATR